MWSYRGLDWKTGAAQWLRPLRLEETVLSSSRKTVAKLGSSKKTPRPLGSTTDSSSNSKRRLIAGLAVVSPFFCFPFRGLFIAKLLLALVWQKQTVANIPPDRLQQHLKSAQLADPRTLQQQKTQRFLHQTTAQKCLEPPSGEPQQHHKLFVNQTRQQHTPQDIWQPTGHTRSPHTHCLQRSQHSATSRYHCLEEIPLSEQRIPYKTLYTANGRIDCTAIDRDSVKIYLKPGYLLHRTTLK